MAGVTFKGVTKVFGKDVRAVDNFDLEIRDKEFMVLVGPSGCGKTTALRMIAGLEEATEGDLVIGDKRVNDVPPKDRDIAMVFQNYALYPHMTVYDNIAFGLRLRELPGFFWQVAHMGEAKKIKGEIDRRVHEAAKMLDIDHLMNRRPKELSGGQRQRVALGRAIVREPRVFLMDEPLSNLDAKLRIQTRAELIRLHRQLGITTIYVTHDQVEAMTMGQRISVMNNGVLQQCDEPEEV
ncbi:MAG TPA: ABC transporter ATP-binding protein, partial [Fimbriimonadaceae bacterium]|nr:ABC transporter ATP-binding protein [Fimbriimonadaceae bacterium]